MKSPILPERASVTVAGAGGRMGRRVLQLLASHPSLRAGAALERVGASLSIPEAGATLVTDDPVRALAGAAVVVDFSAPSAAPVLAPLCAERGVAYLVASTALGPSEQAALDAASRRVAVLQAANLSLGVNVLLELVEAAARRLSGFDVEILELHHHHKKDAPSGTALALGRAVERGRGAMRQVVGRAGVGEARKADELGYAAVRGGDVAGEHTVYLFGEAERLELTHRATSPEIFAQGALAAAVWLVGRPAGLYAMRDVLAG
jgi:4-hydroxy-tetrahydrodipicolinate reductase